MIIQPVGKSDRFGWKETDRSQGNFLFRRTAGIEGYRGGKESCHVYA